MPYNNCTPWCYYGVGFALSIQDEDLQIFFRFRDEILLLVLPGNYWMMFELRNSL